MQFGKKKFPLDNQIVCVIPFVVEQSFPIISILNFCLQAKAKKKLKGLSHNLTFPSLWNLLVVQPIQADPNFLAGSLFTC